MIMIYNQISVNLNREDSQNAEHTLKGHLNSTC